MRRVSAVHPMNIPRYDLDLIDPDDPDDPIRKLAVPEADELILKQINTRQKHPEEASRILVRQPDETGDWLDDLR